MFKYILLLIALCPLVSTAKEQPNVLLICVDDLRPELKSFGVDYIHSPNIDKLASQGRAFHRHYVQAPTCGASRYTLLTGTYGPADNGALFRQAEAMKGKSLPAWFRKHGYTTVSVGKVSHHPGGRGGANWDDSSKPEMPEAWTRHLLPSGPWQHPRGAMHGLANGEIRKNAKDMDVHQSFEGPDTIYPDGLITDEALKQMNALAKASKPFLLAVGIIRPHLPFGAPAKYMKHYKNTSLPVIPHAKKPEGKTTWHGSGEFMKYNRWKRNPNNDPDFAIEVRKHYAACVTYADALIGQLIERLDKLKLRENTIIVLWGDHGWHLGEHAIWGKHALFEESLRSPLIISHSGLSAPGKPTGAIVETLDVFPTICDLAGIDAPSNLDGRSLIPILKNPDAKGHSAFAYKRGAQTIRTDTHRLIVHKGGELELYDHESSEGETKNLAEIQPQKAASLLKQLKERLD